MESLVLAIYDYKDDIKLHCDASNLGFGCRKRMMEGLTRIFFFSKRTTDVKSKYNIFELEN